MSEIYRERVSLEISPLRSLASFHCYFMSVTGKRGVGIPLILLHDAEGGIFMRYSIYIKFANGHFTLCFNYLFFYASSLLLLLFIILIFLFFLGVITVELKDGHVYRGTLEEAQDSMNCTLKVPLFPSSLYPFSFLF